MEVKYSDELKEYLSGKKRRNVSIEVAASDHSDIEVTELFVRLVTDDFADYLLEKKRYRSFPAPVGRLLLPPYRLEIGDVIQVDVKKRLWFHRVVFTGVAL